MHYVIADIHGCYEEYIQLLNKIRFQDSDILYVLGDTIDRGTDGIKVLQDLKRRPNVVPIMGNHEFMALTVLTGCTVNANSQSEHRTEEDMLSLMEWIQNDGQNTIDEFLRLSHEEQQGILDYLGGFRPYAEVDVNEKHFLLVHAGLDHFRDNKALDDYGIEDLIFARTDFNRIYYQDRILITGHTPTIAIDKGNQGTIINRNRHIGIDCGCVYGFQLCAYCMESGEVYYVKK